MKKRNELFFMLLFITSSISAEEVKTETFGNFSNATGQSLIVNNMDALTEVSGYRSDSEQADYINRDHVGFYIGMYGPMNQIRTNFGEVIYRKDGFYLPKNLNLDKIKIGMFVTTTEFKRYSAKIISIDKNKMFIGVSGWFANGNTAKGQIPLAGSPLLINAADKIWGQNTNVFINNKSSAKTATGYELGVITDGSHNIPIWGFHAANLSNIGRPFDQAFRVTGRWNSAYYSAPSVENALVADEPMIAGLNIINSKNNTWSGTAVSIESKFENENSYILKSTENGSNKFYLKSDGTRSNNRLEIFKTSKSTYLSKYGPSIILCKNTSDINITLPQGNNMKGISFEIKAISSGHVIVNGLKENITLNKNNGTYVKFINDGDEWIKLQQTN